MATKSKRQSVTKRRARSKVLHTTEIHFTAKDGTPIPYRLSEATLAACLDRKPEFVPAKDQITDRISTIERTLRDARLCIAEKQVLIETSTAHVADLRQALTLLK